MANLSRLPKTVEESYAWQYDGACRGADPETFFSPEFERGPRRAAREQTAKTFCARCPVVAQCLDFALQTREAFGVWGGLTTHEREDVTGRRLTG